MLHLIPLRRKARQEQARQIAVGSHVYYNGGTAAHVLNITRNPYDLFGTDTREWVYLAIQNEDGSTGSEYLPMDAVRLAVQS